MPSTGTSQRPRSLDSSGPDPVEEPPHPMPGATGVAREREAAEALKSVIAVRAEAARVLLVDPTGEEASELRVTEGRRAGGLRRAVRGVPAAGVHHGAVAEVPVGAVEAEVVEVVGNQ